MTNILRFLCKTELITV